MAWLSCGHIYSTFPSICICVTKCKHYSLLSRLLQQVWTLPGKAVAPKTLVKNIRLVGNQFRHGRQEDAHEYLRQLLGIFT